MGQGKWCCLALLCVAINASAQSVPGDGTADPKLIPRTKAEREAQYAVHHRILLVAQVTDGSGHAVTGLDAQDFTLKINHQPQAIASFQAVQDGGATAHAHAFLVVDLLNSSTRDLAKAHTAIERLAGSARLLPLPTSLAVLTDSGMEVSSTSQTAEELASAFVRVTRNHHLRNCTEDWNNAALGKNVAIGTSLDDMDRAHSREKTADRISSCLNEKFQLSLTSLRDFAHQQRDVPGRGILIWIGPGWPILSGPEFGPDTPHARQSYFANLVQVSTLLREGLVTLDAVSWPPSSPLAKVNSSDWETLMRGTDTAAQASSRSLAMPVLAHISGGQVYMQEKDLTPELTACLADADSYYVLGFDSVPSAASDEFRAIEVIVDRPGLTVRTNTGYFAQP